MTTAPSWWDNVVNPTLSPYSDLDAKITYLEPSDKWQLEINTDTILSIDGIYFELSIPILSNSGYKASAFGIATVASTKLRYMGPIKISIVDNQCGFFILNPSDPLKDGIEKEVLTPTV